MSGLGDSTVYASGKAQDSMGTEVGKLREIESLLWGIHIAFEDNLPGLSNEALQRQQAEFIAYCSLNALNIWKRFKLHYPSFLLEPIRSTTSSECPSSHSFLLPTF